MKWIAKNKRIALLAVAVSITLMSFVEFASAASSEDLFRGKCLGCHLNGKKLTGITNRLIIINKIRSGGADMPKVLANTISDDDANRLADFIISTFRVGQMNGFCRPFCLN